MKAFFEKINIAPPPPPQRVVGVTLTLSPQEAHDLLVLAQANRDLIRRAIDTLPYPTKRTHAVYKLLDAVAEQLNGESLPSPEDVDWRD